MKVSITVLLITFIATSALAQLKVVPIAKLHPLRHHQQKSNMGARTMDSIVRIPLQLPFWDDFSQPHQGSYPDTTHWVYSESVIWSDGMAINPPSLGVVSFNGLDSLGNPYNPTVPLEKGFGDKLISWPIDLSNIPSGQLDSLFFSFFYQYQGNGEPPDNGDYLIVEFKTDTGTWIPMIPQINVDLVPDKNVFKYISFQITNPHFRHAQFQFRLRSFGRISGPWDNWNVDYFFLNKYRYAGDFTAPIRESKYTAFPDRTIVSPPTSLFGDYWAIPAHHFDKTDTIILNHPNFVVNNLRQNQGDGSQPGDGQVLDYYPVYTVDEYTAGVKTSKTLVYGTSFPVLGNNVLPNEKRVVPIVPIPSKTDFDLGKDSIKITTEIHLNSGDNGTDGLDYTYRYFPISFKTNDVASSTQTLTDYYAYDDGTAEFAAGLNQPGTEMAYHFKMLNDTVDNLIGVDLYFPNTGDQSNQTIILTVRNDTSTRLPIFQDTVTIVRSAFDKFTRYNFYRPVHVHDNFFLGWVQTSSVLVAVGLDASHDTADKIFYNVGSLWQSHPDIYGSLMIRPRFGGKVVEGLEDEPVSLDVFPNPSTGSFYLSRNIDDYALFDHLGRRVNSTKEGAGDKMKITITDPSSGLYLLKVQVDGQKLTRRVLVTGSTQ